LDEPNLENEDKDYVRFDDDTMAVDKPVDSSGSGRVAKINIQDDANGHEDDANGHEDDAEEEGSDDEDDDEGTQSYWRVKKGEGSKVLGHATFE
jgi:hypothetical protein